MNLRLLNLIAHSLFVRSYSIDFINVLILKQLFSVDVHPKLVVFESLLVIRLLLTSLRFSNKLALLDHLLFNSSCWLLIFLLSRQPRWGMYSFLWLGLRNTPFLYFMVHLYNGEEGVFPLKKLLLCIEVHNNGLLQSLNWNGKGPLSFVLEIRRNLYISNIDNLLQHVLRLLVFSYFESRYWFALECCFRVFVVKSPHREVQYEKSLYMRGKGK